MGTTLSPFVYVKRSTLQCRALGRSLQSLWRTRYSVPPMTRTVFERRLQQLDPVLREVADYPCIKERINLIRDLETTFAGPKQPPTWVMSTGRCGTRAFHEFLEHSQTVKSYHRGQTVNCGFAERNEMLYRLVYGGLDVDFVRAAAVRFFSANLDDLAYSLRTRRQYVVVHHGYTIFAPLAAMLFPRSQFIHLRRDPQEVLESFISKDQYRGQLEPLYVDTGFVGSGRRYKSHRENFRYLRSPWPVYKKVLWYIHVTNAFAEAFVDLIGPERSLLIESRALFAGDQECFRKLAERLAIGDLTSGQFREHFARPVNAKLHRRHGSASGLQASIGGMLARLAQTGHF